MKRYLFIAEKKSLMDDVQKCYRKHKDEIVNAVGEMDFIPLFGHVFRHSEPDAYDQWKGVAWGNVDYPMIPEVWKVEPINTPQKHKIIETIKDSIDEYDGIVWGTDSDVEGYGICYLVEEALNLRGKEGLRFIEHSLTDGEILQQLLCMTDIHTTPVHIRNTNAWLLRSKTDWLFGMNSTRMVSEKQGEIMTIGRVKAPTIKLVYDNSMAIDNFKVEKYYQVEADYGTFTSTLIDNDEKAVKLKNRSDYKPFPLDGVVDSVERKRVSEHCPKLFALPTLQVEAGKKFGYNPSEVMDAAQSLYDKHKVISYPRTHCPYVSKAKSQEFKMMLSHMDAFPELAPYVSRITDEDIRAVQRDSMVVNDEEVQKESHDALLPTSERPDPSKMTKIERDICLMIFTRLLAQFLPKAEDDKTKMIIKHGDGMFLARGNMVVEQGWRVFYSEKKDKEIPVLSKGDTITAKTIAPVEKQTTPPKRLTQSTLLDAMIHIANKIEDEELRKSLAESEGIGTPATRDSIIKDIINRGYVNEEKKGLYISTLGKRYIKTIEELDIVSPVFAAMLDMNIKRVQRGEADFEETYGVMIDDLKKACRQMDAMPSAVKTVNARCPVCGGEIKTGRFNYECLNGDFTAPKMICGKTVEEKVLEKMIAGESSPVMQFKKKDGAKFEARLMIKDGKVCFDMSIADTDCECPKCGTKLKADRFNYACNNEGCDFKISRVICGKTIDEKLLTQLLEGKTSPQYTFKKKDGNTFKAKLKIVDNALNFDFSSGIECPLCREKEVSLNKAGAFCDCGLKVFRTVAGKELTDVEIKSILTKGQSPILNGLKGKSGKEFSAAIRLKDDGTTEFVFDSPAPNCRCPLCGEESVRINKAGAFCDCGLQIYRKMAGHTFTDAELTTLLTKGKTREIKDFESKAGKSFSAHVILVDGKTEFQFPPKKDGNN